MFLHCERLDTLKMYISGFEVAVTQIYRGVDYCSVKACGVEQVYALS